jgi:hypothetical protein
VARKPKIDTPMAPVPCADYFGPLVLGKRCETCGHKIDEHVLSLETATQVRY